ncbi:hypothetical protein MMC25_002586 [Agyrium rufum]|nr:hypothetical protein [Agyrium rufum]
MTSSQSREQLLRATCHEFCFALMHDDLPNPADLLTRFFVSTNPQITEHRPSWATSRLPFLSKTFSGKDGCLEYFSILAATLSMNMTASTFPGKEGFIVDAESQYSTSTEVDRADSGKADAVGAHGKGQVSVVGKAEFASIKTRRCWKEHFIYRFGAFDKDGEIGHREIWADPLSAWDVVGE